MNLLNSNLANYQGLFLPLKDAGYGEKYFLTPDNEDEEQNQQPVKMEDEIKLVPV